METKMCRQPVSVPIVTTGAELLSVRMSNMARNIVNDSTLVGAITRVFSQRLAPLPQVPGTRMKGLQRSHSLVKLLLDNFC